MAPWIGLNCQATPQRIIREAATSNMLSWRTQFMEGFRQALSKGPEYWRSYGQLNAKGGTGDARGLKEVSESEGHADSFDEIGPVTEDKFTSDHGPMNLSPARGRLLLLLQRRPALSK
jgi:hypothetical protein